MDWIILLINIVLFWVVMKWSNGVELNITSPISLFNIGFFYSYFISGFLFFYDRNNFTIYENIRTETSWPEFLYFTPAWLGLVCMNYGYLSFKRNHLEQTLQKRIFQRLEPNSIAFQFMAAFLLLGVISSFMIFKNIEIRIVDLLGDVGAWEEMRNQGMHYWSESYYFYLVPVYLGFFHIFFLNAAQVSKLTNALIFIGVLFSMIIIGSRALILSWFIGILVYYEYAFKKVSKSIKISVLALVATAGAVTGILQKISTDGAKALELDFPLNLFRKLQTSYDQFENLFNFLNVDFDYDLGRSIFEDIFLTYMPKWIFPWKPIDVGYLRAQNVLFYEDYWSIDRGTSYPVGIIAELYFNFWYVGVALGMLFFGYLLGHLELLGKRNQLYLPVLCAISGMFLAPHRTFGTVIMTIMLYLIFSSIVERLDKFSKRGY